MNVAPLTRAELSQLLADANARGQKVSSIQLSALNRLLEHKVEDMTATAETGLTLAGLQEQLGRRGQWLPVDPPHPDRLSLCELLAANSSGPRRFGYGLVRDYVIGMEIVLADGRLIHSGGKVVKNVAGYDLMKLFIGSRGSLGVVVQVTLKVMPRPEKEAFVQAPCTSLEAADQLIESVLNSDLTPSVLDLHNLTPGEQNLRLVIGFSGTVQAVQWQVAEAAKLGFTEPGSLDYNETFFADGAPVGKLSVLPSRTCETIRRLGQTRFVARAGNGIIYHLGTTVSDEPKRASKLEQRLKDEFDPKHIFPELCGA
jgi:glycolate dehydrogenase FAD-binding subunit